MNSYTMIFFVFLAFNLLSGCAGVAVGTYGKHESAQENFCINKEKNNTMCYNSPVNGYTQEEVISLWGKPDKKDKYKSCVVYLYDNGVA